MHGFDFKKRAWVVRGLISAGLAVVILVKVGPNSLIEAAKGLDLVLVLWATMLAVPRFALKTARWKTLAERAVAPVTWREALSSSLVGTAGGVATPGRIGQVSSALALMKGKKLLLSGLSMVDLGSDFLIVVLLAASEIVGPLVGVTFAVPVLAIALSGRIVGKSISSRGGRLGQLGNGLQILDPLTMGKVLVLAAAVYSFNLVQFHLLLSASVKVPFSVSFRSLPLIFLAVALPVGFAGLGVREATAALVLASFGIEKEVAVQASFQLFVINMLIPGLIGAFLAGRIGFSRFSREGSS